MDIQCSKIFSQLFVVELFTKIGYSYFIDTDSVYRIFLKHGILHVFPPLQTCIYGESAIQLDIPQAKGRCL